MLYYTPERLRIEIRASAGEEDKTEELVLTQDNADAVFYRYDAFNRLVSVEDGENTASYTYDGNNLRQSKTVNGVTTTHIYDGAEVTADITGDRQSVYVRDLNGILFREENGEKMHYISNPRGDVSAYYYSRTRLLPTYTYDAFGNQTEASGTDPFRYSGEYYDAESGFIYLRNRYYDPSIGRFITEDPAQSGTNWYVYANNNPLTYIDPWGLDAIVITTSTMSVYGNAHTSMLVQDNSGNWYYFYWGNKNAVLLEVSADKLTDLDTFNAWLVRNCAGKGGEKTDKPLHDSSDEYTTGTYIEGNFSASVSYFLEQAKGANMSEEIRDGKHEYKNNSYGLLSNNCMMVSFDGLKRGMLTDETNFGNFAKFDGAGSVRPNDFRVMIRETFANQEFTRLSARNAAIGDIGVQKPWYMSQNYYNQGQKYGRMLRGY